MATSLPHALSADRRLHPDAEAENRFSILLPGLHGFYGGTHIFQSVTFDLQIRLALTTSHLRCDAVGVLRDDRVVLFDGMLAGALQFSQIPFKTTLGFTVRCTKHTVPGDEGFAMALS